MTTAAIVIFGLAIGYCFVVAGYCLLRSGLDRADAVLRSEHRPGQDSAAVISALSALNPAYRFRRYADDERLVTRTFTLSASALADESR